MNGTKWKHYFLFHWKVTAACSSYTTRLASLNTSHDSISAPHPGAAGKKYRLKISKILGISTMWFHTLEPFVVILSPSHSHCSKPLAMSLYQLQSLHLTLSRCPCQLPCRELEGHQTETPSTSWLITPCFPMSHDYGTPGTVSLKKKMLPNLQDSTQPSFSSTSREILTRTLHWLSPSIFSPGSILTLIFFSLWTSSSDVQALPGPLMTPSSSGRDN